MTGHGFAGRPGLGLVSMTQSALVLVVTLVITALGFRPFGGGSLGDGPVSATNRDGDFELTIRTGRSHYAAGEPIDVSATLTYLGAGDQIEIGHDVGQDGAPIGFGVAEPIFPGYFLSGPASREICHRTLIAPAKPIMEPFIKSGGGSGAEFVAYLRDPVFWLSEGTWHPIAIATFSFNPSPPGTCAADVSLQASIAITVGPRRADGASAPAAAASPGIAQDESPLPMSPGTERWKSTTREGDFELSLDAAKGTFSSNEMLAVVASLSYVGPDPQTVIGNGPWGLIEFSMKAPGITLHPPSRSVCTELDLERNRTVTNDLLDLYDQPQPFRVPHGLHEINAFASFRMGGCTGQTVYLGTTIVVAVIDGPGDIPLLTDVDGGPSACMLMRNGGELVRSDSGLGVMRRPGTIHDVVWPNGFSAHQTPRGVVLVGRDGELIAHEGDYVVFDAVEHDGPLWPCGGDVHVEAPPSP